MAASLRQRTAIHEVAHAVCALVFGIPVISVTVDDRPHLHRGRYHAPTRDLGFEAIAVLCLSGIAAEEMLCGPITDGGDLPDLLMVREHIARSVANPLRAVAELLRCKSAAERLVRSEFARDRIGVLADALLRHGTLSGEQIHRII
jgi:hypothetical protein